MSRSAGVAQPSGRATRPGENRAQCLAGDQHGVAGAAQKARGDHQKTERQAAHEGDQSGPRVGAARRPQRDHHAGKSRRDSEPLARINSLAQEQCRHGGHIDGARKIVGDNVGKRHRLDRPVEADDVDDGEQDAQELQRRPRRLHQRGTAFAPDQRRDEQGRGGTAHQEQRRHRVAHDEPFAEGVVDREQQDGRDHEKDAEPRVVTGRLQGHGGRLTVSLVAVKRPAGAPLSRRWPGRRWSRSRRDGGPRPESQTRCVRRMPISSSSGSTYHDVP